MGELHLEIIVDRMKREFKVEANVGAPQVAYRETISKVVRDRLHPQEADRRFGPVRAHQSLRAKRSRASASSSRKLDRRRLGAEGIHPGRREGPGFGAQHRRARRLPVIDFKVNADRRRLPRRRLSVLAFEIAARAAFKEGLPKAGPKLLEPMMKVEVVTPEDYMGDVIGDLNSRRGQIRAWTSAATRR
jgi:elongation factor G